MVRGNCGSVHDSWTSDSRCFDSRQPAPAHVTDRNLLGAELASRGRATHARAAVFYSADVCREESLVGGSVVGSMALRMRDSIKDA